MATLDTPTPKRSVSFGPNSGPAPPSFASGSGTAPATPAGAGASASSSAAASPGAALKPALKATAHLPLPPAAQYAHADPLLRRLRLVDAAGAPVDLRAHFRDAKVVAFYFSSQWAGQPLREYTQVRAAQRRQGDGSCSVSGRRGAEPEARVGPMSGAHSRRRRGHS
jgi:hypothetical protein